MNNLQQRPRDLPTRSRNRALDSFGAGSGVLSEKLCQRINHGLGRSRNLTEDDPRCIADANQAIPKVFIEGVKSVLDLSDCYPCN